MYRITMRAASYLAKRNDWCRWSLENLCLISSVVLLKFPYVECILVVEHSWSIVGAKYTVGLIITFLILLFSDVSTFGIDSLYN